VTGMPSTCSQLYDAIPSSGSVDPDPSNVTVAPWLDSMYSSATTAVGDWFCLLTFTIHESVSWSQPKSVTTKLKLSEAPSGPTSGAVKVGWDEVGLERVTAGPLI